MGLVGAGSPTLEVAGSSLGRQRSREEWGESEEKIGREEREKEMRKKQTNKWAFGFFDPELIFFQILCILNRIYDNDEYDTKLNFQTNTLN